jgi:predicted Zn finger-like uncharacterized protein
MIIQCEKCQTRFRLDDSRVTVKGVKVRCTKCRHVFTVRKEGVEEETLQPVPALAELSSPAVFTETSAFESTSFGASELSFDSEEYEVSVPESNPASPAIPAAVAGEFDFSEEGMCGTVVQTAAELVPESISFNFEDTNPAEVQDVSGRDSDGKNDTPLSFGPPAEESFNPGEIDFGDVFTHAAVAQVGQDEQNPVQPLAETAAVAVGSDMLAQSFLEEAAAHEQQQEELPPLSIPSRRKQSPLFGVLIAIIALMVITVLGYFGYSSLSTPKNSALSESGKIGVRSVKSTFIRNSAAGELLVVSGEAFNEYAQPRAALQIMVTVLDANGQKIASKNAYGGNPLTKEQLETMPLDKIEATMANPFGDSLANIGVAPGKSIPFVVVLANIPAGAKDFSVQSAGSTVATGK